MDKRAAPADGRWSRFLRKPARDKVAAVVATTRHLFGRAVKPNKSCHHRSETSQRDLLAEVADLKTQIRATMPGR